MLLLTACAPQPRKPPPPESTAGEVIPRNEPRSRYGNPPFYEVEGRRYVVRDTAEGYLERGVASWYGADFHGKRTSSGETYDMDAMTAAHPTLPLPCYVQVTNLQNGRSIVLRVNDRGPFRKDRIIDLSRSAATRLDMIRDGTAMVEVRAITTPSAAVVVARPQRLYAQAGAFQDPANAQRLADSLRSAGIAGVEIIEVMASRVLRVRAGPVATVAEFDALMERLRRAGVPEPRLSSD